MKVLLRKLAILSGYIVVLFIIPFFPHVHQLYQIPLVLSIVLASALYLFQPLPLEKEKDPTYTAVILGYIACLLMPMLDYVYFQLNLQGYVWVGFAISAAGLIFRNYSILYLGKQFTADVRIVDDHHLVDTGPYKFIRHPSYTGTIVMLLGNAIMYGSVLGVLATFLIMIPVYNYRIQREEKTMCEFFGPKYKDYISRTRKFI